MKSAIRRVEHERATRETQHARTNAVSAPARRAARVLLVDDDSAVRESLCAVLDSAGYSVIPARNGDDALRIIAHAQVDLVVLDLNMPVRGGWETFAEMVRDFPLLPVVIATARPNQLFTALNCGVSALLEKPLDIPAFLRTVEELLAEPPAERVKRAAGQAASFRYGQHKPGEEFFH